MPPGLQSATLEEPVPQTLSEIVIEEGLASQEDLRKVAQLADKRRLPLVCVLVRELALDEVALVRALAKHSRVAVADPGAISVDPEAVRQVARAVCERRIVMPISISLPGKDQTLTVATADPTDAVAVAEVEHVSGCAVRQVLAPLSTIEQLIADNYRELVTEVMPRKREPVVTEPMPVTVSHVAKPITQPHHRIADEADAGLRLQALIRVLRDKGLVGEDELEAAIVSLMKERTESS